MKSDDMIDQIRIYYECLEQADVVIKKNIDDLIQDFPNKPTISLIRLKNGRKSYKYYSKNIAPIIMWKNPDILVSVIKNKIEYPVLMAEFSNAVFTEDHELQRFDGYIAAAKNNCIYIKISPLKRTSGSSHGGNTNFDHVGPYSLIYKKFKRIFFHFDCECNDNGDVIVNNDYLSCPSRLENFDLFLKSLFSFIYNTDFNKNWIKEFEEEIIKVDYFKEWKKKLETFVLPDVTELNSTRIQWNDSSKELVLKINRFGHAMDPERGMLAYYGTLYQNTVSKMIFDDKNNAWYNGTPKSKEIDNYINSNGLNNAFDYLFCFMMGSGLYNNNDFHNIVLNYQSTSKNFLEIDLTNFIFRNYDNLSKPLRTIFDYSIFFFIEDKFNDTKIKFIWNKSQKVFKDVDLPNISKITDRTTFEEDEVTYITVHNILKPNGYKILAVSYPGAQGDRAILVAPGTGRRQKRSYIDIISYLPSKFTSLQENKGKFNSSSIQNEINELSNYKNNKEHINAIDTFLTRFDNNAPRLIKIGVGFWANPTFNISKIKDLDISNLDYFVYVTPDMKEWHIWRSGDDNLFNINKGKITLPKTYEIKK